MLKGKCNEMDIQLEIQDKIQQLLEYGTSEGVKRSWLVRQRHLQKYVNIATKKLGISKAKVQYASRDMPFYGMYVPFYKSKRKPIIIIAKKTPHLIKSLHHELAHHVHSLAIGGRTPEYKSMHGRVWKRAFKKVVSLRK